MLVYKFGGASVKDAKSIKNIVDIISKVDDNLIVVISAMGKMTNAFENLINAYFLEKDFATELAYIIKYHKEIIKSLDIKASLFNEYLSELELELKQKTSINYHYEYDRIIGFGELFSTIIIFSFIEKTLGKTNWIDIRSLIKTDSNFRFAKVNWETTLSNIKNKINFSEQQIFLTQGFIASDENGNTTSLGREGSDYTAAILGYGLNAKNITVWKDVPGVLDVDPRIFNKPELIEQLSFYDAIELAFFGAQVIHPNTIQPLKNKQIPLYVKSFLEPLKTGTLINHEKIILNKPIVIIKKNQVLLSITSRDFSFIDEQNISAIFSVLSKFNAKVNLMQNGAVSFSIVVDYLPRAFDEMIITLNKIFDVRYNSKLELITIRYYSNVKIKELTEGKIIYLEQKSRNTAQYLIESKSSFLS